MATAHPSAGANARLHDNVIPFPVRERPAANQMMAECGASVRTLYDFAEIIAGHAGEAARFVQKQEADVEQAMEELSRMKRAIAHTGKTVTTALDRLSLAYCAAPVPA